MQKTIVKLVVRNCRCKTNDIDLFRRNMANAFSAKLEDVFFTYEEKENIAKTDDNKNNR